MLAVDAVFVMWISINSEFEEAFIIVKSNFHKNCG